VGSIPDSSRLFAHPGHQSRQAVPHRIRHLRDSPLPSAIAEQDQHVAALIAIRDSCSSTSAESRESFAGLIQELKSRPPFDSRARLRGGFYDRIGVNQLAVAGSATVIKNVMSDYQGSWTDDLVQPPPCAQIVWLFEQNLHASLQTRHQQRRGCPFRDIADQHRH